MGGNGAQPEQPEARHAVAAPVGEVAGPEGPQCCGLLSLRGYCGIRIHVPRMTRVQHHAGIGAVKQPGAQRAACARRQTVQLHIQQQLQPVARSGFGQRRQCRHTQRRIQRAEAGGCEAIPSWRWHPGRRQQHVRKPQPAGFRQRRVQCAVQGVDVLDAQGGGLAGFGHSDTHRFAK